MLIGAGITGTTLYASAMSSAPLQDPDALYQLGAKVGEVQAAVTDPSAGTVTFGMIYSAMNLNVSEDMQYRNYVLHIQHYGGEAGNHPNGIWLERRLYQVACKIISASPRQ